MPGSALTRRGLESGIVVYFRNQVDYVRSLYLELPQHGDDASFDELRRLDSRGPMVIRISTQSSP